MNNVSSNSTLFTNILEYLKDIKSEAAELRYFTLCFMAFLLYINIIISVTDAEQILRITPVILPLLNVPIPIIGFYGFMPWLLLLFHQYLLIQHYLFSQQLFLFKQNLNTADLSDQNSNYIYKSLGNLTFVHWMIGEHRFSMQAVLTFLTLVCLLFWPLVTLLWLQMTILPFHSENLIWSQRAAIALDVLILSWLWPKTLDSKDSSIAWWKKGCCGVKKFLLFVWSSFLRLISRIPYLGNHVITEPTINWHQTKPSLNCALNSLVFATGLFTTLFLSFAVATLPGSWEEQLITNGANNKIIKPTDSFWFTTVNVKTKQVFEKRLKSYYTTYETSRVAFTPTAWLHEQHPKFFNLTNPQEREQYDDLITKGGTVCPSVLNDNDKYKEMRSVNGADDSKTFFVADQSKNKRCLMVQPWLPRNLILRNKTLIADATLNPKLETKLKSLSAKISQEEIDQIRGLDLQSRNLDYADFTGSILPKANFSYVTLKDASFERAKLNQAQFYNAHLENTNLFMTNFEHANLSFAKLNGAILNLARMEEADLSYTNLAGTNLPFTTLFRANLNGAYMLNSNMEYAVLAGANLSNAKLHGAIITSAKLLGANLSNAELFGADLFESNLTAANLSETKLFGTSLINANLTAAILVKAQLPGADLSWAQLNSVILIDTQLPGAKMSGATFSGALLLADTSSWSGSKVKEATEQYRQALALTSNYQGKQELLDTDVELFKNKIQQIPVFSTATKLTPCLRKEDAENLLPDCVPINSEDEKTTKAFVEIWTPLACGDLSKDRWLARQMVERAEGSVNFSHSLLFAKSLQQASQYAKKCPGLFGLPEEYKTRLKTLETEFKEAS